MNEYGFDYFNYITNVDNNVNFMKSISGNSIGKSKLIEPYLGFIRGNSFLDEYVPYKNYKPMELSPDNEREALLYQLLQYKFVLTDLNLYLDTNPNDQEMIQMYRKYLMIEKQICDKYESMYGPLTLDSNQLEGNTWKWKNSPWPWEVM